MRYRTRLVAAIIAAFAAAGCPGGTGGNGDTTPGDEPPDFTPGPPLEDPPAADPSAFGAEYIKQVGARYQERWHGFLENCRTRLPPAHELNDSTLATALAIDVDSKGTVVSTKVATSSGNPEFDQVALEVARDSGTFPAPPVELLSDDDLLHIEWLFARDRRQAGLVGASMKRVQWEPAKAVPKLLSEGRLVEASRRLAKAGGQAQPDAAMVALLDDVASGAIRAALESEDVAAQRSAVKAAAAVKPAGAGGTLRVLAKSAVDLDLRREAIAALGSVQDSGAAPLLTEIVSSDVDDQQRGAAAQALHAIGAGDKAWEVLAPSLSSGNAEQKLSALIVLAHFPAEAAVPQLAKLLKGPNKRSMRLAAAAALGVAVKVARHQAAKPLIAGLKDRDAAVRAACAQALADAARAGYKSKSAYWEAVKLLKDKDNRVRSAATLAAAVYGRASFAKELYRLRKEKSPLVLAALAEGLASVPGDIALARLLGLADQDDAALRRAVAGSLLRRGAGAGRVLLASWAGDPDLQIGLLGISVLDDPDRLQALLADERPQVQAAALWRFAVTGGRPAALEVAAGLLADAPTQSHRALLAGGWLSAR